MGRGGEALEKSEAQKGKKGVHEKQTPLFSPLIFSQLQEETFRMSASVVSVRVLL